MQLNVNEAYVFFQIFHNEQINKIKCFINY